MDRTKKEIAVVAKNGMAAVLVVSTEELLRAMQSDHPVVNAASISIGYATTCKGASSRQVLSTLYSSPHPQIAQAARDHVNECVACGDEYRAAHGSSWA